MKETRDTITSMTSARLSY